MRLGVKKIIYILLTFLMIGSVFAKSGNKKKLSPAREGKSCIKATCKKGLKCIRIDDKEKRRGKAANEKCKKNSDCYSESCRIPKGKKVGSCEREYRCVKPIKDEQACFPGRSICLAPGICQDFNQNTANIGECSGVGQSCSENLDCCSNKCNRGKCEVNKICKSCSSQGEKPKKGQRCCEGLYEYDGVCLIDVPPPM